MCSYNHMLPSGTTRQTCCAFPTLSCHHMLQSREVCILHSHTSIHWSWALQLHWAVPDTTALLMGWKNPPGRHENCGIPYTNNYMAGQLVSLSSSHFQLQCSTAVCRMCPTLHWNSREFSLLKTKALHFHPSKHPLDPSVPHLGRSGWNRCSLRLGCHIWSTARLAFGQLWHYFPHQWIGSKD